MKTVMVMTMIPMYNYIKLEAGSMETELGAKERGSGSWKQLSPEDTPLPKSARDFLNVLLSLY